MGERLFLTILQGPNARDARPIIASEDQGFIREVGQAISRRLGARDQKTPVLSIERSTRDLTDE
jgi:hypothetical protein